MEDSPRWHLGAAEDAMDQGRWDIARAAVERARESIAPGTREEDEAGFVALRLAVGTMDLRTATTEVLALIERRPPEDAEWNRRVRRIIAAAPPVFAGSMRAGLLDLLPPVPDGDPRIPHVALPPGGLPDLPEEEPWPAPGETALPPIPTESPFAAALAAATSGGAAEVDAVVMYDGDVEERDEAGVFPGRLVVAQAEVELRDADLLRDRLVESMLSRVTEAEGRLLFETATTFLINREFGTAEVLFSAGMQLPGLRVASCEGLMRSLVGAERFAEAVATGTRALRIFARDGDALLGIAFLLGQASEALGDLNTARACYERVAGSADAAHFRDLDTRRAAVR